MRSAMALAPAHHGDSAEGGVPVYERISLAFRMADGCDAQRCLMRGDALDRIVREAARMNDSSIPADLSSLATKYGITPDVLEDLYARRRAGARDAELVNLLRQQDRGGLDAERARAVVAELPAR